MAKLLTLAQRGDKNIDATNLMDELHACHDQALKSWRDEMTDSYRYKHIKIHASRKVMELYHKMFENLTDAPMFKGYRLVEDDSLGCVRFVKTITN